MRGISLLLGAALALGCAPVVVDGEVRAMGPLVVASERGPKGPRAVAYAPEGDGTLAVVAKAEVVGDRVRFARRGFDGAEHIDASFAAACTPRALALVIFAAHELARAECPACAPSWTSWEDAPESARFDFATIDELGALRAQGDVVPRAPEARALVCGGLPRFAGDQVCTGWAGQVATAQGPVDWLPCCARHDACYFDCPREGESCNGTACIAGCNHRLKGCCEDAGGDALQCGTFEIATNLGGGGGRNGCGRDRMAEYCAELDVDEDGCGAPRCVCDACREEFPDGPSCDACTCESTCLPTDEPACMRDGLSHAVRRCRFVDYGGGVGCFSWFDERCGPGQVCAIDGDGAPTCVAAACPRTDACDAIGDVEPACRADASGAYYRVCGIDTDGCLAFTRVYCDGPSQGDGVCVLDDDVPRCVDRP